MNHTWSYCPLCKYTMVICGTCGNNTCNGGYGTINNLPCPDCESAHELCDRDFRKHNCILWLNIKYKFNLYIRIISNLIYYITHNNYRKLEREYNAKIKTSKNT